MEPITRRVALAKLLAAGASAGGVTLLAGCGNDDPASPSADSAPTTTTPPESPSTATSSVNGQADAAAGGSDCHVADDTTAGPYPDTLGMVGNSEYERSDITEGLFGDAVPLSLTVLVADAADGCTSLAGLDVEIWHCNPAGAYSEYSDQPGGYDGTGETYLRGWQTTDDSGAVTFQTIYPGWYIPRTTHIHIQVYKDGSVVKTTQLGFDDALNSEVNASAGYGGANQFTNDTDQVFVDEGNGAADNLIDATGSVDAGFIGTYTVGL